MTVVFVVSVDYDNCCVVDPSETEDIIVRVVAFLYKVGIVAARGEWRALRSSRINQVHVCGMFDGFGDVLLSLGELFNQQFGDLSVLSMVGTDGKNLSQRISALP